MLTRAQGWKSCWVINTWGLGRPSPPHPLPPPPTPSRCESGPPPPPPPPPTLPPPLPLPSGAQSGPGGGGAALSSSAEQTSGFAERKLSTVSLWLQRLMAAPRRVKVTPRSRHGPEPVAEGSLKPPCGSAENAYKPRRPAPPAGSRLRTEAEKLLRGPWPSLPSRARVRPLPGRPLCTQPRGVSTGGGGMSKAAGLGGPESHHPRTSPAARPGPRCPAAAGEPLASRVAGQTGGTSSSGHRCIRSLRDGLLPYVTSQTPPRSLTWWEAQWGFSAGSRCGGLMGPWRKRLGHNFFDVKQAILGLGHPVI